uniref:rRNA N-glycosylase n=1 Tax=Oryza barthii TaxID=65489 RepID=A0A0D3FMM1_9ORYZ
MAASFHATLLLLFFLLLAVAGRDHHLVVEKYGAPTATWCTVHLAVHKHDYSFAGFANRSGHWHVFPGDEDVLLDNARRLPFRNTYRDLISGLKNVPGLPLGRAASLRAIGALSSYDADAAGEEAMRRGVATLSMVLTQALRLRLVGETVSSRWESGEARVAAEHLPYIEHWYTMSFEVLRWRRTGRWDGPFTELLRRRAGEALAVVRVIANKSFVQLLRAHNHGA